MAEKKLSDERISRAAYAHCLKASEIAPQGVQLYLFDVKRLGAFIEALASPPVAVQEEGDAKDAARWRRLVNASDMPFPILTIADDPENDCLLVYGRKRLEELVDMYDEIPDSYDAMKGDQP